MGTLRLITPRWAFPSGLRVMEGEFERGVTRLQFLTSRPFGLSNYFGPQFLGRLVVIVVEFEFDVHLGKRGSVSLGFPCHLVKEDVFTEIFGLDETEFTVFLHELNFAETLLLDMKRLLRLIRIVAFIGWT